MTGEYRILRIADDWNKRIGYTVQIKRKWWIFSWWGYLYGETGIGLTKECLVFGSVETAREWALEFLKGRIVEEGTK